MFILALDATGNKQYHQNQTNIHTHTNKQNKINTQMIRNRNSYEQHFRQRGTETSVRFSIHNVNSLISQHFDPQIKQIRMQLAQLKKQGNNNATQRNESNRDNSGNSANLPPKSKSELWLELLLLGMSRSLSFVFLNCFYHLLCHIYFAIIARRYRNEQNPAQAAHFRRNLLLVLQQCHSTITRMFCSFIFNVYLFFFSF